MSAPDDGDPQQDLTTSEPQDPTEGQDQTPEPQTASEEAARDTHAAESAPTPESGVEASHGDDAEVEADDDLDEYEEESTETTYEQLPGGVHRVTRRTVRRRVTTTTEDIDEHVVEDLPADTYRAPAATGHPAPVG